MAEMSIRMMPCMMSLFWKKRRAIELRTFRDFVMLSSAPWSVSRAWMIVSRCECSCRMMSVPSSSVSRSCCFPAYDAQSAVREDIKGA